MTSADLVNRQTESLIGAPRERAVGEADVAVVREVGYKTIVAIIPAYNEERFIGSVVLRVQQYADVVIVVDDGSIDATAEVARAAGALVVCHDHNQGKGVALNTGFRQAREFAPDVVVTI